MVVHADYDFCWDAHILVEVDEPADAIVKGVVENDFVVRQGVNVSHLKGHVGGNQVRVLPDLSFGQ